MSGVTHCAGLGNQEIMRKKKKQDKEKGTSDNATSATVLISVSTPLTLVIHFAVCSLKA